MGFVRGSYLDVYATALAAVIGILIGILLTFYIVGKFIYRKLSKNREVSFYTIKKKRRHFYVNNN